MVSTVVFARQELAAIGLDSPTRSIVGLQAGQVDVATLEVIDLIARVTTTLVKDMTLSIRAMFAKFTVSLKNQRNELRTALEETRTASVARNSRHRKLQSLPVPRH